MSDLPPPPTNVEVIWTFACGHNFSLVPQLGEGAQAQVSNPWGPVPTLSSTEKCPACKTVDARNQKVLAEQGQKDAKAVKIWQIQAEGIKKHIDAAKQDKDDATVKELQKMLKNCNKLWAERLPNVMLEQICDNPAGTHVRTLSAKVTTQGKRLLELCEVSEVAECGVLKELRVQEKVRNMMGTYRWNVNWFKDDLQGGMLAFEEFLLKSEKDLKNLLEEISAKAKSN